jgi:hypothetical protein
MVCGNQQVWAGDAHNKHSSILEGAVTPHEPGLLYYSQNDLLVPYRPTHP